MSPASEKSKSLPRLLRRRTLLKLAIFGIFIAALIPVLHLAIPALAYRDDLLALLNYSDDCRAPCFMGITPGVTTREEALKILEQHEWVYEVWDIPQDLYNQDLIEVWLSKDAPYYMRPKHSTPLRFYFRYHIFSQDYTTVQTIYISTSLPFKSILNLGLPTHRIQDRPFWALYLDKGIGFDTRNCVGFSDYLEQTEITFVFFNRDYIDEVKLEPYQPDLFSDCGEMREKFYF